MIVTLLTDFGLQDTYTGVLKGVIKTVAPCVDYVDLTHQVSPGDIEGAAFLLLTAYQYFPAGTVHLVVVDPGVGARGPIAARLGDYWYVCPDNGVLSYVLAQTPSDGAREFVTLDKSEFHLPSVSRTFHGRDMFAPAAAQLTSGVALETLGTLGTPCADIVTLPVSAPEVLGDMATCHVIHVDVFGNVILDMTDTWAERLKSSAWTLDIGGVSVPGPTQSYSDVETGAALWIWGSSGHAEIAVRDGSAARLLGLERGHSVVLRRGG